MKNNGYINILGWMINELKLKGNELLLYAMIYGYSQDGKSVYRGSLNYIAGALSISKTTTISIINKLIEGGYIEKIIPENKNSPTEYKVVEVKIFNLGGKETVPLGGKETVPPGVPETVPNIYNNINKTINNIYAGEIFSLYKKDVDIESKYLYPSATKLYIEQLLKEYDKEQLIFSIQNYFAVTEKKWRKSPKYFFSNSKRSDNYRMFEGFLNREEKKQEVKRISVDDYIP